MNNFEDPNYTRKMTFWIHYNEIKYENLYMYLVDTVANLI